MKKTVSALLVLLALAFVTERAGAIGKVYARIPNYDASPIYNLRIKSLTADVVIRDQLAVTHVDQVFANDNPMRLEGFYVFALPEGAQVHEMYLWINGVRVPYTVKKREDAVVTYQEIVRHMSDPAILEQLGNNLFKLRIFPFDPMGTRRIEIVYSQPLAYFKGSIQYVFPLSTKDYSSDPIENASISIDIRSQLPLLGVSTSMDEFPAAVNITRVDSLHTTVVYGVENMSLQKDFQVRCNMERKGHPMIGVTYSPKDQEDPYVILWSAIPDTLYGDSVTSRELTFVADVSSSMEGERLQQLKDALGSFVDLLSDQDRFNIIAFSTAPISFRPDLVAATPSARDSARSFVSQLVALGLTNFEAALHDALLQSYHDSLHSALVFVTDGQPSWGQTRPDSLLRMVGNWNSAGVKIFPFGIGEEPDVSLLQQLADQNGGAFTAVAADDSIYLRVHDLYRLLFLPKLRGITLDYGTAGVYDRYPEPIPDVFAGDQLLTTARFAAFGTAQVVLTGRAGGRTFTLDGQVDFRSDDTVTQSIARYWGAQKIKSILQMISAYGEKQELVDQVIALSIKYSVLTPYTAFLVVEPSTSGGTVMDVAGATVPLQTELGYSYPNPFNPSTRISYTIGSGAARLVTIKIYDVLGRLVKTLVEEFRPAGSYTVEWNSTDDRGARVSSGVYFVRMTAGQYVSSRSIVLMK